MRTLSIVIATVLGLIGLSSAPAQAHSRHHPSHYYHHLSYRHHHRFYTRHRRGYSAYAFVNGDRRLVTYRGGFGGRPRAWCGWYMRKLLGVADPAYNLARNWAHWGHAGHPGIGAVVVWAHHVGRIVGGEPGHWLINSGNDGHAVRTRIRSISGAIAFRWG